jgi:VWFA-related protein
VLLMLASPCVSFATPPFSEVVNVDRVIIDARVVDDAGAPLFGLAAADFHVEVDGRGVALESVHWVPAEGRGASARAAGSTPSADQGRMLVFFFQKDLHPLRAPGFLRMREEALKLARALPPQDRVAVVSFDSRLHLWLDFTTDRDRLARVFEESVVFSRSVPGTPEAGPSLARFFNPVAARKAATPERALQVIGEALQDVPGAKSLVLFGWGMGRLSPGVGVQMEPGYEEARAVLTRARVTVFALDVTNADYHTLEAGLQQVADDTGGFYARTHLFTAQAMRRLEGALAGHYELTFVKPTLPVGEHEVEVQLRGRKGRVLARRSYGG